MEERCLECKHCEITECGRGKKIAQTLLSCDICEEETTNKDLCFEQKLSILRKER